MPDGSAPAVAVLLLLPLCGAALFSPIWVTEELPPDGRPLRLRGETPMTTLSVLAEAPPNQPAALRSSIAGPRCAAGRVFGACMASVQSVAAGAPSGRTEFSS